MLLSVRQDAVGRSVPIGAGRVLDVWEGGEPDGVPIVFHHGTPAGRLQAQFGDEAAHRQGVRLISSSRPGYGRSSDSPPSLASVGVDTMRLMDALAIDDFAVLGASGGGPYAIATGLADPARVRAVGVAAGIGPWRLIDAEDEQDPEDVRLLARAEAGDVSGALDGFRAQGRMVFDDVLKLDDEDMAERMLSAMPGGDTGWLNAEAKTRCAADVRDAMQTYDGFARDNVAFGVEWDIDPSRLDVPTWIWHGERDLMVPPSHARWVATRISSARLVMRQGEGHNGSIFEHWDDMLATLRDEFSVAPGG